MRGGDKRTGELFSYVDLEKRVRSGHPLRAIRGLVNAALVALEHEFSALYRRLGGRRYRRRSSPSDAVAGVLFNPVGTATDGAAGV